MIFSSAAIAVFLVGVNAAFLLNLGNTLVLWFKFKIRAISLLLTYAALSFTLGQPDGWRAVIGLLAMLTDLVAVFWMWRSILGMAEDGTVGLVPLVVLKDESATE